MNTFREATPLGRLTTEFDVAYKRLQRSKIHSLKTNMRNYYNR